MSYEAIVGNGTNRPLNACSTVVNSRKKNEVSDVVQALSNIYNYLEKKHIIQEQPSSQNDITQSVFEKLTRITQIQEKAGVAKELNINYVKYQATLQSLKAQLNEAVTSKANDDIVNDVLGG